MNLCGIVVAILKMATGRNFSMSEINLGHHNLPIYEMALTSDNVTPPSFMKFCPVVPEICRGQVHVPKKERRRKRIIIIIIRNGLVISL